MEQAVRVFLIRHGETEWNKSMKYQGHKDIPLSDRGREQAEKVGFRLAGEDLHAIYASDLGRAVETAKAIAKHHKLPVTSCPELRETNFGCWEGLTYNEILQLHGEVMANWRSNPLETKIPEGECLQEVVDRTTAMFWQLVEKHRGQNIVITAHGGTNRIIMAALLGMKFEEYWKLKQDNVCVNIIEVFGNRAILCHLNDTCHLR